MPGPGPACRSLPAPGRPARRPPDFISGPPRARPMAVEAGGRFPGPAVGRRPPGMVEKQVDEALPDLFGGEYGSVLYVGANRRRQHFLDDFVASCGEVVVLEAHRENAEYIREMYERGDAAKGAAARSSRRPGKGARVSVVLGDVRAAAAAVPRRFDACFFWHGPEHLSRDEAPGVLRMLESMADRLVVLGMPYGRYEQGAEYGNEYEAHLWHMYPEDARRLGYEVSTVGRPDDDQANMMAWKRMRPAGGVAGRGRPGPGPTSP